MKLKDGVCGGRGREVGVWVQTVERAHAGEGQIAEDIAGDERRAEQEQQVGEEDGGCDRAHGQAASAGEHEQVAGAHGEREGLKATSPEPAPEAVEGAARTSPARPRRMLARTPSGPLPPPPRAGPRSSAQLAGPACPAPDSASSGEDLEAA